MLPSRHMLGFVAQNAAVALLSLCSSASCPPAILPASRPVELPDFAQLAAESRRPRGSPAVLGGAIEGTGRFYRAPGELAARDTLRLGLARLAWLEEVGALRGPAQAEVLRCCREVPSWAPLLDARLLTTSSQ